MSGMNFSSCRCDGIYRFIMRNNGSGLLIILSTCM